MEAALAEFKAEDLGMDAEEDADFAVDKGTRFFTRGHALLNPLRDHR